MLDLLKSMPVRVGDGLDLQGFLKDYMKKLAEETQKAE